MSKGKNVIQIGVNVDLRMNYATRDNTESQLE